MTNKPAPTMVSVYDGRECIGVVLQRFWVGALAVAYEAFTADEQSLGIFSSRDAAAAEVWRHAHGQPPAQQAAVIADNNHEPRSLQQREPTRPSGEARPDGGHMTTHPRFVITFSPGPGVDSIRSLRLLLKAARRRFGLVAVDAYEDRSSPLEISTRVADEFRELRDEIVAERADRGAEGSRP
jgi:hypothetical protein